MRFRRVSLAFVCAATTFALAFPVDAHAGWTDRYEVRSYGSSGGGWGGRTGSSLVGGVAREFWRQLGIVGGEFRLLRKSRRLVSAASPHRVIRRLLRWFVRFCLRRSRLVGAVAAWSLGPEPHE
jgi:hypothetical protein